jgi:hypothetical protein
MPPNHSNAADGRKLLVLSSRLLAAADLSRWVALSYRLGRYFKITGARVKVSRVILLSINALRVKFNSSP